MTEPLRYYSFRQLSPFRGYCHIIESADTQAVTHDGLAWQINVKTNVPTQGWGVFGAKSQSQAVLFGFWESEHGIKRLPLNPLVNIDQVERSVKPILDNIAVLSKGLPFKPIDDYELWLLDKQLKPLVLIAAASKAPLTVPKRLRWHATATSDLGFFAPSLNDGIDVAADQSQESHIYRDAVERLINEEAAPQARWYKRTEAAADIVVNEHGEEMNAELVLQKTVFPPCLIREKWDEARAVNLVADYIRWQAPLLLQLFGLDNSVRRKLEILARQAPIKVTRYHKLYPEIIDQQQINAALVEAVMTQARIR